MQDHRLRRLAALTVVAVLATGCGNGTEPDPGPVVLSLVSGDGQSAEAGEAVSSPLVVSVRQDGMPIEGTLVTWTVTAGGGTVDPTSATTGAAGTATTNWTLGTVEGANTVQASASGVTGSPVTFSATGTGPPPPPPAEATVEVDDNFFDPSTQRLAAGGTVTWTWVGNIDHNVTFPTGTSSNTQSAGTFERTFATEGSFPYQCTIHGGAMSGTITVE